MCAHHPNSSIISGTHCILNLPFLRVDLTDCEVKPVIMKLTISLAISVFLLYVAVSNNNRAEAGECYTTNNNKYLR